MLENQNSKRPILCELSSRIYPHSTQWWVTPNNCSVNRVTDKAPIPHNSSTFCKYCCRTWAFFVRKHPIPHTFSWILSLWGQIFALISGKCYVIGLVFYPLKDIQSSHKLYRFLFHLTKLIPEIYRNLDAPQPLESQAYLITAILDNSEKSVPKNWEWVLREKIIAIILGAKHSCKVSLINSPTSKCNKNYLP